ncbi:MAG: GxxExxY protein [bacterium]|nr:GxxExxY protein [bacterium]
MQVHSFLGNGFQEVIYQRALALEFEAAEISFERELEMPIFYKQQFPANFTENACYQGLL